MIYSTELRPDVVGYVENILTTLEQDLQSITITRLGNSGVFCVTAVINSESEEVLEEILKRFDESSSTSTASTPGG